MVKRMGEQTDKTSSLNIYFMHILKKKLIKMMIYDTSDKCCFVTNSLFRKRGAIQQELRGKLTL